MSGMNKSALVISALIGAVICFLIVLNLVGPIYTAADSAGINETDTTSDDDDLAAWRWTVDLFVLLMLIAVPLLPVAVIYVVLKG